MSITTWAGGAVLLLLVTAGCQHDEEAARAAAQAAEHAKVLALQRDAEAKRNQAEQEQRARDSALVAAKNAQEKRNQETIASAAARLNAELKAADASHEAIAGHLVELSDALAAECRATVARQAQSHWNRMPGASAWLVEMPKDTLTCLSAEPCTTQVVATTSAAIRELPPNAAIDRVKQLMDRGRLASSQCAVAPARRYDAAMRRTLELTQAPPNAQARLFVLVAEANDGAITRISGPITARPDSSSVDMLPVAMTTPGLSRARENHSGVFVAVMPELVAPTWTFSIEIPMEVRAFQDESPEVSGPGLTARVLSFDFDAFEAGVLESTGRIVFPGSRLEEAQREIKQQHETIAALEVSAAENAELASKAKVLQAELERAHFERRVLERYDERLASQIEKHSKGAAFTDVIQGIASKAIVAGVGALFSM